MASAPDTEEQSPGVVESRAVEGSRAVEQSPAVEGSPGVEESPAVGQPPGVDESPADQAWAILRGLFFAERRRLFAAAAEVDLHPSQVVALLQMEPGVGMPMHEMASVLGCDNSNVTGLVDRLEARGLVARRPYAHDRRVRHIVLTQAGADLREHARTRVARAPEALRRLKVEDQRLLLEVMERVAATG